jgi:uncharacterized protein involved in exopolysaccharide biosynthesis
MIANRQIDQRLQKRLGALRRYWLWILMGGCVCAVGALVVSLFLPRIYRATTYLLVSDSKIGDTSRDTNLQQMAMLPTFIPFVDNDALIDEALKKFQLDQPPHSLTASRFRRRSVDVRVPKSTRLLELNIEFPDARLAADLANEIAQGAVRFNDRLNATDTVATQQFLKKHLDQAQALQADADARRLGALQEGHMEDRETDLAILLAEKDTLSTQLQKLRQDLAQNESRTKSLEKALASEPEVISLKKSVTSDRFTEQTASKVFPDGTPLTVTEESVNETREGIRKSFVTATVDRAGQTAGIEAAEKRMAQVNKEITELVTRITALRGKIDATNQDFQLAVEATKSANHEYQTASVTVSSKSQDIKQIAPALIPERPVRPNILVNTLMAFLLGTLLLAVCAMAIESYREMELREKRIEGHVDETIPDFEEIATSRRRM